MNLDQYIKANNSMSGNISAAISLLQDGATVPFIARYRKEATGNMDEVDVTDIKNSIKKYNDLISRKETIIASIKEQGKLTPELVQKIEACWNTTLLEDIYLPYKRKRKTRADVARESGLEGLAKTIMAQRENDPHYAAGRYVKGKVNNEEEALAGARDIIAEWISENTKVRDIVRQTFDRHAVISSKAKKVRDEQKKQDARHYKDYFDYSTRLDRTPGHRILAMRRGEREGLLSVSIDVNAERLLDRIDGFYIRGRSGCAEQIGKAVDDSYKRLVKPSIETEFANKSKEKADKEAIDIFTKNLSQLLLESPLGEQRVIGIDPGFRTGCKVVVLDEQGDLLASKTIYPHPPQQEHDKASKIMLELVGKYKPQAFAIGNGTAGRETESFVKGLSVPDVEVYLISEAGASIYSASAIAREEFPDLDLTVRGAISIGRRLMDPLAELIKIDAKSIGVGQYQHDVDQNLLKQSLEDTVVSAVNKVGINLNTASKSLLAHVSGLGPTLAERIVDYRKSIGQFKSRKQLSDVKGLGKKAFEQAAGFLRIKGSDQPLDDTNIHPERYNLVKKMAKEAGLTLDSIIGNDKVNTLLDIHKYVEADVGLPTLKDIVSELQKPGHDPRGRAEFFSFDNYVRTIDDIKENMYLPGIIVNVAKFGAFVDLGIKENGLIHISEITDRFISDPNEVLSVNQKVNTKVIGVDRERNRIQLSLKN